MQKNRFYFDLHVLYVSSNYLVQRSIYVQAWSPLDTKTECSDEILAWNHAGHVTQIHVFLWVFTHQEWNLLWWKIKLDLSYLVQHFRWEYDYLTNQMRVLLGSIDVTPNRKETQQHGLQCSGEPLLCPGVEQLHFIHEHNTMGIALFLVAQYPVLQLQLLIMRSNKTLHVLISVLTTNSST